MSSPLLAGRTRTQETGVMRRQNVQLGAAVVVDIGYAVVTVAGFGHLPAMANAATGKIAGMAMSQADNTLGADGALSVVCEDGTYDFKNDGTHPCSQADVGNVVYLSDFQTISNNSADGPPAGRLVDFAPANQFPSHPCRVRLDVQ